MKHVVLICGLVSLLSISVSRAGSVVTLADRPEFEGKLTLHAATIHVEGSSPSEINLPDVLEADFSDVPFRLDYFSTEAGQGGPLPMDWRATDGGQVNKPGTVTYVDGTMALSAEGSNAKLVDKTYFFVGRPWTGDGQLTVRVKQIDDQTPQTEVGLMLRDSLDATSSDIALGATAQIANKQVIGPVAQFRLVPGSSPEKKVYGGFQPPVSIQLPVWLRLTRSGGKVAASVSSDGKQWDGMGQFDLKNWTTIWAGFFLNSHRTGNEGKAVLDQVSFTPPPSLAQVLPAGVLLRSGSFLAGSFEKLDLDPANPDAPGTFHRVGKPVLIPGSKIAAVLLGSTARSELGSEGAQAGLIMKNGDFLAGTPETISSYGVRMNSVLLGIASYDQTQARASILQPPLFQPANFEIRLTDGSNIRANSVSGSEGLVEIDEISGVEVTVTPDEIAQIRAGSAETQSLFELAWKVTPPAPAPLPAVNPAAGRGTNAAPMINAAPAANPASDQSASVPCFSGNNQEQIMMAPVETAVEFTLTSRFRSLAMRIALAPDAPPNAQAVIRILAGGREVARTPPFRAGEQPRFLELKLEAAKTVTLVADSSFAGTKMLFIDPVAIR